jgi:hypothetical protein
MGGLLPGFLSKSGPDYPPPVKMAKDQKFQGARHPDLWADYWPDFCPKVGRIIRWPDFPVQVWAG